MIAKASGVATLVGLLGGGIWGAELHYATKTELAQHRQDHQEERRDLRVDVLETRRTFLEQKIFELEQEEQAQAPRPLPRPMRDRLEELRKTLEHLEDQIRSLTPAVPRADRGG